MPRTAISRAMALVLSLGTAAAVVVAAQIVPPSARPLDEHPAIEYATRPTTDRAAKLNEALARGGRTLHRDGRTGYLVSLLNALDVPAESQLLVFSKTGVQRTLISPRTPRALYFNDAVAVGYVPGAPLLEIAAHDPQQGVIFYTLDQAAAKPVLVRQTMCLTCHVSASTLGVPGVIARSHIVGDDGNILPQTLTYDVNHETSHTERWGGYFVTSEDAPPPYSPHAHAGNVTFTSGGNTSNQVFVEWINSEPERHGYLSALSDIAALLVFDHQMYGINLLTTLNWQARVAAAEGAERPAAAAVVGLVRELADYLLFVGEAPPLVPLTARPGFVEHLKASAPNDRLGRSLAELDLNGRLFRYPCSYLVYSDAFNALPRSVKSAVYARMADILLGRDTGRQYARLTAADRTAVLEILRETKPDFDQVSAR